MNLTETVKTLPIKAQQSVRPENIRALTSCVAGKVVPLAYIPLLREDRVSRSSLTVKIDMMETAETLMNGVHVDVRAYFVPFLAFDRFNGLDQLNRSYKGEPEVEGGSVVPFFPTVTYYRAAEFWSTLGVHWPNETQINAAPLEAYNVLVNHRRKARSSKLPLRNIHATDLAEAFWHHTQMKHIVPDFDQASMDGEIDLNIAGGQAPVTGIGVHWNDPVNYFTSGNSYKETGGNTVFPSGTVGDRVTDAGLETNNFVFREDPDHPGFPGIFAELQSQGVTLSLANIELAKKTAAFAEIRKQYAWIRDDDHLVDLLMESIRVPDAQLSQPLLLDRATTLFGYSEQPATDGDNLGKSVTTGETFVKLNMRTPAMNTGGIIMVTAEIVPEQLFERQKDHFLGVTEPDSLPSFTRDFLDPEKVSIVANDHVDVLHGTPAATFGYAPLNHEWRRDIPRIGGKYFRQVGDPFVEDRQKIWAVETVDPSLTSDFYLVNELHHNVFADQLADAFEITTLGSAEIVGNTVFGKGLQEDTNDYQEILEDVDTGRIDQGT